MICQYAMVNAVCIVVDYFPMLLKMQFELSLICGSIGTVLLHTRVRDGASKAGIERQFGALKETWLYTLDLDSITSLKQFNSLLKDYMRSYNTTFHSGIGTTPLQRYQDTRALVRMPKSREWLEECFPIRPTDKNENCRTKRNNPPAIDYSKIGGEC